MNYGLSFSQALEEMNTYLAWDPEDESVALEAGLTDIQGENQSLTRQSQRSNAGSKATQTNDTVDALQKASQTVEAIGAKMLENVESVNKRCLKLLNNVWTANEEYIAQYNEMSEQYKLLDQVVVINWTYGHDMNQYLHAKVVKLQAIINRNAGYLSNWQNIPDDALINKGAKEMTAAILEGLGAPSGVDDMNEFIGHLRAQFRGRKSEKTYRGEMANKFIQEVRSFAKTKSTYKQDMDMASRVANNITNTMKGQVRNSSFSDEDRRSLLKMMKSMQKMLSTYTALIYFVYRLEVEYILNRKAIISQLYQK